jgi:hypothetical protein
LGNNSPVEEMLKEGGRRRGKKPLLIYLESTKYEAGFPSFLRKTIGTIIAIN